MGDPTVEDGEGSVTVVMSIVMGAWRAVPSQNIDLC